MSESVELIPDDGSDKTMEEVQQAAIALAPPSGVGRPLPTGNGLPGSVRDSDRPHLRMYQDSREFVQKINIMNNMADYAEMRYAVNETEHEAERRHQTAVAKLQQQQEATIATRDEQFQVSFSDGIHRRNVCQARVRVCVSEAESDI